MEEDLQSNNNSNMNGEEVIQNNNNNNNNINHSDTKKLVLTIKVNDETEPVNNNSGGSENEKIIHVNGSTAIHIMTPPPPQTTAHHGSSAISSIPINIPQEDEIEYLNGVSEEVDEGDGEEFDFSSSDFEDAQEEISAASLVQSEDQSLGNVSLTLADTSDMSILQSPGPLQKDRSMDLTPDIVDIDTDQQEMVSPRKSVDENEGRTEDDVLISQFFGKANEIVGFNHYFNLCFA